MTGAGTTDRRALCASATRALCLMLTVATLGCSDSADNERLGAGENAFVQEAGTDASASQEVDADGSIDPNADTGSGEDATAPDDAAAAPASDGGADASGDAALQSDGSAPADGGATAPSPRSLCPGPRIAGTPYFGFFEVRENRTLAVVDRGGFVSPCGADNALGSRLRSETASRPALAVAYTNDGGVVLAQRRGRLAKFGPNGEVGWTRTNTFEFHAPWLTAAEDGDVLLAGRAGVAADAGTVDVPFVARYAEDGTLRWFREIAVQETIDWSSPRSSGGGRNPIMVKGAPGRAVVVALGFTIVKLDADGHELWRSTTQPTKASMASVPSTPSDLWVAVDGTSFVSGWAEATGGNAYLVRVDAAGTVSWSRNVMFQGPPRPARVMSRGFRLALQADGLRIAGGDQFGFDLNPSLPPPVSQPSSYRVVYVALFDLSGASRGANEYFLPAPLPPLAPARVDYEIGDLAALSSGKLFVYAVEHGQSLSSEVFELVSTPIPNP